MGEKIGRNSLCPCGSGLKYKKCCLGKPTLKNQISLEEEGSRDTDFHRFLREYDSDLLLRMIIGAQLMPENQGKEIRLELITQEIVKNLTIGRIANRADFIKIIDHDWPSHYLEDPPSGLFAENVVFYGGNYTVLPGISLDSGSVFIYLFNAIFFMKNSLPENAKRHIYSGCTLLLELVTYMLKNAGIRGNVIGEPKQNRIIFRQEATAFSKESLINFMSYRNADPTVIDLFLSNIQDERFNSDDPDDNPLIYKPLICHRGEYYYTTPIDQLMAINSFIKNILIDNAIEEEINNNVTTLIWHDILSVCRIMGWLSIDIPIPKIKENLHYQDAIFQFDTKHLAYVILISSPILKSHNNNDHNDGYEFGLMYSQLIRTRTKTIMSQLKSDPNLKGYNFLSVILLNSLGQDFILGVEKPTENIETIFFSAYDFIDIGRGQEWDRFGIWKFAKAYRRLLEKTKLVPSNMLDVYGIYKSRDYSFYFSDEERPNSMFVVPGSGHELVTSSKIKRDYHGVLKKMSGKTGYIPVVKHKDYAPIYRPIQPFASYSIYLESFGFPFWIINNQCDSESKESIIDSFIYAIGFWLTKLADGIINHLQPKSKPYIELVIEFELRYFEQFRYEEIIILPGNIEVKTEFIEETLHISIPIGIYKLLYSKENSGERYLTKEILLAVNRHYGLNLTNAIINSIVDEFIPLGPAKMILPLSTGNDIRLDPRWLYPALLISESEINMFLDELPFIVFGNASSPQEIENTNEKIKFCHQVVRSLVKFLIVRLSTFDKNEVLSLLLQLNETLIKRREFNKIQVPAQIHCFGNIKDKVKEFEKEEGKLVNTALSVRCLIELTSCKGVRGNLKPSYDEIEELLVIMSEIINFGILSDSIYFGLDDPKIGILPSGRIGISKEFHENILTKFKADAIYTDVEYALEHTSKLLDPQNISLEVGNPGIDLQEIDEAFLGDIGISYSNLYSLIIASVVIAEEKESSAVEISEKEFLLKLQKKTRIPLKYIECGLILLSLNVDDKAINEQEGYTNKEFYPWKYNRRNSFIRKPFIVIEDNGVKYYKWGMRHIFDVFEHINDLLFGGRLRGYGTRVDSLRGKIEDINGGLFRDFVKDWLKNNSCYRVWDFEIKISPNGHLSSDSDLGDIDILIYDNKSIIISIECKKTSKARIMHEMKTELDSYFGKDGKSGKISKHVARDKWLKSHMEELKKFINVDTSIEIKSLIITSEVIPLPYLKNYPLPFPLINFPELKRLGSNILVTN